MPRDGQEGGTSGACSLLLPRREGRLALGDARARDGGRVGGATSPQGGRGGSRHGARGAGQGPSVRGESLGPLGSSAKP